MYRADICSCNEDGECLNCKKWHRDHKTKGSSVRGEADLVLQIQEYERRLKEAEQNGTKRQLKDTKYAILRYQYKLNQLREAKEVIT